MKNPNGYGSIYKLSGNRRKPFAVRITTGWDDNGKQTFKYVGYYASQSEALIALADYHMNPFDLDANKITFKEIYEKWSKEKFAFTSASSINAYNAAFKTSIALHNMKFVDIKKNHLQNVIDTCGKNYPSLRKLKVLFNQLFKYAMQNDLVTKDYSNFIEISHHKSKVNGRLPFKEKEIKKLWSNVSKNEYIQIVLILIYTGVRISELLDLKKENVHLDKSCFDVIESKTDAGIRVVPIADKILPFFCNWIDKFDSEYIFNTPEGDKLQYRNYYDSYWKPLMEELNLNHKPHDTRHTTVSLLVAAEVNQTIIKKIVGHSGAMSLTERVYTHFDIQQLLDAINKI
ncbi:MAG: site-specific integrase [Clostridia bacterium]|nr:site-specific integrase [Clostridia bacterium]